MPHEASAIEEEGLRDDKTMRTFPPGARPGLRVLELTLVLSI